MKLADQSPVMVETGLGPGRMLVCSFAATPGWSNLPTRALFVPLLLRSIAHLRPAAAVEAAGRHSARTSRHRSGSASSGKEPGSRPLSPDGHVHPIDLHRGRQSPGRRPDANRRAGLLQLSSPAACQPGQPSRAKQLGLAVNLDIDQADFASVGQERVDQNFRATRR